MLLKKNEMSLLYYCNSTLKVIIIMLTYHFIIGY